LNARLIDFPDNSDSARVLPKFSDELVAVIPHLRAFSRALCRERGLADEMTQEVLAKAWRSRRSFEPGTNLRAWAFTILRNEFYSRLRRSWREVGWEEGKFALVAGPGNVQQSTIELSDTVRAMSVLPRAQRDALILVGAGGFSYEEAAAIYGTRSGTMKSRVARARIAIRAMLDGHAPMPVRSSINVSGTYGDVLAQLSTLQANSHALR
jgi:RNA polymerase sigma-70 factor (ECF subfamily)